MVFVALKGLALYRENTVLMHEQNSMDINLTCDIINDKFM